MLDRREIERLRQVESDAEQEQLCLLDVEERDQ